jgi:hypothetical protein
VPKKNAELNVEAYLCLRIILANLNHTEF